MTAHVMILGCGRSGTSIFGELFEDLGQHRYVSEPPFDDVMAADFSRPTAFKVPRESKDHPAPPGLSFPFDAYAEKAPTAAIFWIVRNPLDAICSLRVGIQQDWGHHPRPPDWRRWLDRPLLERCAHHWAFINTAGFSQLGGRAHLVKFEHMIADPMGFALAVCAPAAIDVARVEPQLARWVRRVQDINNSAFVEARTSRGYSRPDHKSRVGRWRENLTLPEAQAIWPIVAAGAQRFGYVAPTDNGAG